MKPGRLTHTPRHVAAQLVEYETWLDAEEKKQAKLATTAPPSLLSADVQSRLAEPRRAYARLKGTKKPKPPPAAPTNATGNGTANGTVDGAEGADPAVLLPHLGCDNMKSGDAWATSFAIFKSSHMLRL